MAKKKKYHKSVSVHEAKLLLARQGKKIKPSYHHKDYMFTGFSMPYDIKAKLDRIKEKWGIPRSSLVTILIDAINEDTMEFNK